MVDPLDPASAAATVTPPPEGAATRFRDTVAVMMRPSGLVGLLGICLLLAAVVYTAWLTAANRTARTCIVTKSDWAAPPKGEEAKFRIVRVLPVAFQFHKQVCVVVENVVAQADVDNLSAKVDAARKQAATDSAPAAAARLDAAHAALASLQAGAVYKLYINGQPSTLTAHAEGKPGIQALPFTVQPEEDASSANASYWRNILSGPNKGGKVPIEIGLAPESALAPTATAGAAVAGADPKKDPIYFVLYTPLVMWVALAGMACVLIGLGGLAHRTPLLREGRTAITAYSLSRVQMAFWLVLTSSGFLYVWLVTGEYMNVFPSALFVLIGISGVTAGAAQLIDGSADTASPSRGFLHDIAGDWIGGQPQLHRIQIMVWTVILGLIFCWNIVAKLQLTSFDTNLLILAGVANGVYISLKPRENA